jgi:uncharacterized protein YjiS (DUF1127 family)
VQFVLLIVAAVPSFTYQTGRQTRRLRNKKEGSMLLRSHAAHAAPNHWNDVVGATWRAIARGANRAWRNAVTRRELATLDDHMLADIGFTRGAALDEADRFPWDDSPRRRQPLRISGPSLGPSVWQRAATAWERHRSRQRIARLDAHDLKDIGVSFAEAEREANKPFWRS